MRNLFIYKENGTDDRDCVKYIDNDRNVFECGHYFTEIDLTGACFCQSLDLSKIDFDNITSILTKEDFIRLDNFNKSIDDLGCCIKMGDERYNKGIELNKGIKDIFDKLESQENRDLFEEVKKEEIEFLEYEYDLTQEEVEDIFNEYGLNYRDRGVIGVIYNNIEECAEEYAEQCMDIPSHLESYIDYEKLGEDLLEDEYYFQLDSGRVVYLNY